MTPIYIALFVAILVVLLLHIGRVEDVRRRIQALSRIETKLDLLLQQSGIEFAPYKGLPPAVIAALKRDQKIEAIKAYRATTQISLREAKDRIEEAQRLANL